MRHKSRILAPAMSLDHYNINSGDDVTLVVSQAGKPKGDFGSRRSLSDVTKPPATHKTMLVSPRPDGTVSVTELDHPVPSAPPNGRARPCTCPAQPKRSSYIRRRPATSRPATSRPATSRPAKRALIEFPEPIQRPFTAPPTRRGHIEHTVINAARDVCTANTLSNPSVAGLTVQSRQTRLTRRPKWFDRLSLLKGSPREWDTTALLTVFVVASALFDLFRFSWTNRRFRRPSI